jgi:CheY-like chemotaxis protein
MKLSDFVMLLVEDDPNDILLIQRAFAKACLVNPLKVVRDGEEALNYLSGSGEFADRGRFPLPSLILLDLKLPRKSGLEILQTSAARTTWGPTPTLSSPSDSRDCWNWSSRSACTG